MSAQMDFVDYLVQVVLAQSSGYLRSDLSFHPAGKLETGSNIPA